VKNKLVIMKSLKLNAIFNDQLNKRELSKILGGTEAPKKKSCGCICAGSADDNSNASTNHSAK